MTAPKSTDPRAREPRLHLGHPDEHIPMFDPPETPSKALPRWLLAVLLIVACGVAYLGATLEHVGEHAVAPDVHVAWVIPFALLLGSIALMPFIARHFWEHNYHWVAITLGLLVSGYYIFFLKAGHADGAGAAHATGFFSERAGASLAKSFGEYISFIFLLGSLYIVSGGILIRVRRKASPAVNTGLLLLGALIANVVGTTGAAMLLIRPFLRMNKGYIRPYHVVFFIFIVANVGGALTPIGDPPLFLGYLKGVPFWWVLEHCWPMWAVAVGALLGIFFIVDTVASRKTSAADKDSAETEHHLGPTVSVYGVGNVLFVALILFAVFQKPPYREMLMALAAVGSLWTTARRIHVENHFNYAPIREVALLFVGIFATMVPALNYLSHHAKDETFEKYLHTPGQYYFITGTLSSVLDNAPTYLTFVETELGKIDKKQLEIQKAVIRDPNKSAPSEEDLASLNATQKEEVRAAIEKLRFYHREKVTTGKLSDDEMRMGFLIGHERLNMYLIAISLGAVFFGACTYIGNGPNFMVRAIAEHAGVKCPSFFGYVLFYTLPVLVPILILIWGIFLTGH